ncbi:MFS transporter [Congregibacter variabilis]|uniref:MFS transporter n=1 Tax=Congregibacter variabilis TaxID=3081200 RepID=A0ABZ0HXB9_9GAMM|nr:MFS transporter [Congregibacter sp. IMCC43200]
MTRPSDTVFELLSDEEDARACKDISEDACKEQPQSFLLQLLAQIASKCADTLGSSRVVLPWLLSSIGAPAFFIAWLVPVRESLSLIPQLAIAAKLRKRPIRKGVYVLGAVLQGLCMLAMPLSLLLPEPSLSAFAILLALAVFSVARGLCSVAAKDVLGKTVAKGRRGRLSGLASSAAGIFTIGFGLFLLLSDGKTSLPLLVSMLCVAGILWLSAALLYGQVPEQAGATEGGASALGNALRSAKLLKTDSALRAFVLARVFLISTAYTIPFLVVMMFANTDGSTRALAFVILAEGLAALTSGVVWGIYADRAAHQVMMTAGVLTAVTLTTVLLAPAGFMTAAGGFAGAIALYVAAIAHQGTRLGRKTYVVDLANADNRAAYVAISNSVIGLFVFIGGSLGWVAQRFGNDMVLAVLLAMALLGAVLSWRLKPV